MATFLHEIMLFNIRLIKKFHKLLKLNPYCVFTVPAVLMLQAPSAWAESGQGQESGEISISPQQLGAEVEKNYVGENLGITALPDSVLLRAGFQKLNGLASTGGLWLESTAEPGGDGEEGIGDGAPVLHPAPSPFGKMAAGERFRVLAAAVGRQSAEGLRRATALAPQGQVTSDKNLVTFSRPGLREEYRVGVDGVRQDFVVEERPAGNGDLILSLSVSGARAAAAEYGALLTLAGSGREIGYSRLLVSDAVGRRLNARLEVASADALRVIVEDTAAAYPVRIDPTFSDADWLVGNSGFNGPIRAVVVKGSQFFVGGDFTRAGAVAASRMARWTGEKWVAMGTGVNGVVNALVVGGTDLYAAGNFTSAGGVSVNRIAKWDNTAWSDVGGGIGETNASVLTLAARSTDIYVGGRFNSAGSTSAQNIAKWDAKTSTWSALGAGVGGTVKALAFYKAILFAGGTFSSAGTAAAANIAKWNGTVWSALGSGVDDTVLSLASNGVDVFAGGYFTAAGGTPAYHAAKWDDTGKAWSALGAGPDSSEGVNALAVSSSGLYAAVGSKVARWSGRAWANVGSGTDGEVLSMATDSSNHLLFVGSFTTVGGSASPYWAGLNLPTGPDINLYVDGNPDELLPGQPQAVNFGVISPGSSATKTFTFHNDGVTALDVTALTLPQGFEQIGAGVPITLAPTASASVQVRFTGGAAGGDYSGTMVFTSNDPNEASFSIPVLGKVDVTETPQQSWRKQHFDTTANSGDAADDADPDHDGIVNLLEWACNLNPKVVGTLPLSMVSGSSGPDAAFEFIYTRSKSAKNAGTVYSVEWNNTLPGTAEGWSTTGVTESIVSGNAETEQVKALVPQEGQNKRFVRLRVTSPK